MKTTNFLLSLDPELDKDIIDYLAPFKKKKKGADEVRKAMRLYIAYRNGDMNLLQTPHRPEPPAPNSDPKQNKKPKPFIFD